MGRRCGVGDVGRGMWGGRGLSCELCGGRCGVGDVGWERVELGDTGREGVESGDVGRDM